MNEMKIRIYVGCAMGISFFIYCVPPKMQPLVYKEANQFPFNSAQLPYGLRYMLPIVCTLPYMLWINNEINSENNDQFVEREKIAIVIFIIGLALHLLARYYLGKFYAFSYSIQKDQTVINKGPYSIIRHPGYLSNLLVVFGSALFVNYKFNYLPVVLALLLIARIYHEENMMKNYFKKQWDEYCRCTKYKLIPFLY
eukprot:528899_1